MLLQSTDMAYFFLQILVHGETNAMGRLKSALMSKYSERDEEIHIFTPRNTETVKLYFRGEKLAKVKTVDTQNLVHDSSR